MAHLDGNAGEKGSHDNVIPSKSADDSTETSAPEQLVLTHCDLKKLVAEAAAAVVKQLTENQRAKDGGSSATQEEPMLYTRIYGPYEKRGKFHLHLYLLDGEKKYRSFTSEEVALSFLKLHTRRTIKDTITTKKAVEEYVVYRVDLKESSRTTVRFRLESLIRGHHDTYLQAFPARSAWQRLAKETESADTLCGVRTAANGFFKWSINRGLMKTNPLEGVEIIGKKKRRKEQLRLDEARRLLDRLIEVFTGRAVLTGRLDGRQEIAALGLAADLLLGFRSGEVVNLAVRDLDEEGCSLWVADAKTKAGNRRVQVPEVLQPGLRKLAEGKSPTDLLFGDLTRDGLRYWLSRLCKELNLPRVVPHSLRGTHATASQRPHANPHEVAAALGHASPAVTLAHYADPQAVSDARQQAAMGSLLSSKNSSKTFGREKEAA